MYMVSGYVPEKRMGNFKILRTRQKYQIRIIKLRKKSKVQLRTGRWPGQEEIMGGIAAASDESNEERVGFDCGAGLDAKPGVRVGGRRRRRCAPRHVLV